MTRCPLRSEVSEKVYFSERDHDVLGCNNCDLFVIRPYPGDVSDVHESVEQYTYSDLQMLAPERQYVAEAQHFPHHDRKPYSAELFNAAKWRAPGRNWKRNLAKAIVVRMPGALPLLTRMYGMRFGRTIISSFVVLARA